MNNSMFQKFLIIAVVLLVIKIWWKNRPNLATKCASVWATTCTECRQIFFEMNSDIDNDPDLLAGATSGASDQGISLWNWKVESILEQMVGLGKLSTIEKDDLLICLVENESNLKIAK